MRLAVLNMTSGGLSGGYNKYLNHILPRLQSHPKISALLVGMPESMDYSDWQRAYPFIFWTSLRCTTFSKFGTINDLKQINEFRPDVIYIPTARSLKMQEVPVVTMIQNMEPLVYNDRNPFFEKIINRFRAREAYQSIVNSNRIIAISHFVKEFLIKKAGVINRNIGVVYHGTDAFATTNSAKPTAIPYDWKNNFLFTAGSIRPARGLEDIINSMMNLTKTSEISGLVIAGNIPPRMGAYYKQLTSWIEKNRIASKICWAGNLSDEEMKWCYQNCHAFIMTSRIEACPNTALEAMSQGCISVSSDCAPMPEIFKGSAVYYPARDYKALSGVIKNILSWNNIQRKSASERAKDRSTKFSWDICADRTIAELEKALEEFRLN